jgi:hypothetical protein
VIKAIKRGKYVSSLDFDIAGSGLVQLPQKLSSFMVGLLLKDSPACGAGHQLVAFTAASEVDLP